MTEDLTLQFIEKSIGTTYIIAHRIFPPQQTLYWSLFFPSISGIGKVGSKGNRLFCKDCLLLPEGEGGRREILSFSLKGVKVSIPALKYNLIKHLTVLGLDVWF